MRFLSLFLVCFFYDSIAIGNYSRWIDWKVAYHYTNDTTFEEEQHAFRCFQENLIRIDHLNSIHAEVATFSVNSFTHMCPDEFIALHTSARPQVIIENISYFPFSSPKTKVDWRLKGVIGPVSSSSSPEATVVVDTIHAFVMLAEGRMTAVSLQQIIDCAETTATLMDVWKYVVGAGGLMSASSYPTTDHKGPCRFQKDMIAVRLSGYVNIPTGENNLRRTVTEAGPVGACVDASEWQSYSSGILTQCGTTINHCVEVVGYDDFEESGYWIVKNNWGREWGESGYIKIEMGSNLCLIADDASYPVLDI